MERWVKELRYSIRSLVRHPGFTVIAVVTLALGIGANTAIFSVVNAVLLRALPFQNPDRLVSVGRSASSSGLPGLAAYEYLSWSERSKSFEDIAAYSSDNFNLIGQGEPEKISCGQVTANLFKTLGVSPIRGRVFVSEEDRPGQNQVLVVSEGLWKRRFGADETLVGRGLTLDDKTYTVVGIMPNNFRFPSNYDIWMPLALDPQREFKGEMVRLIEVVGRLRPAATPESARAELSLISQQLMEQDKERFPVSILEITPLHQQLVAGVRRTLLVLWGAVALIMLLACANVASLMLSRTLSRRREMAVRAAVGAQRWQLVRQLLNESVVLGLSGGLVGLVVALWSIKAVTSLVPEELTRSVYDLNEISIDWRVFLFTMSLSVLTGVIFGLAPALTASKPDLIRTLRESTSHPLTSLGLRSVRGWFVVTEVALATVLLLAAGLLVRSFIELLKINTGFDRQNVLTVRLDLPRANYPTPAGAAAFQQELIESIKRLPAVQSAGTINHTPLSGFGIIVFMGIEGAPEPDRKKDNPIGVGAVSSDYFRTLKIPLVEGREFNNSDSADAAKVALVNQAFARRYFPNDSPLGKRISFGCKEGLCRTIVGVVGNVRQESLTDDVSPEAFLPSSQMPMNSMTLFVRTNGDPLGLVGSVRNTVFALDRNQPVYDVKTLDQRVAEAVSVSRSLMLLFTGFAALALMLSVVGVYGIVAYSVRQRTHEIGIRMALGARSADVLKLIMKSGAAVSLLGVAIGLGGAVGLTRFLQAMLFGVTPTDRVTFLAVGILLSVVALAACLIPARRATKVDPLDALRYE